MMPLSYKHATVCLLVITALITVESRRFKLHYKDVTSRETNVFNFVRLVVVRLIYGVATMMGFEEGISDFANGALVPPGVDDDYGGDIGGVDDDRDYDYDY